MISEKEKEKRRLALMKEIAESGIGLEDEDEAIAVTQKHHPVTHKYVRLDENNRVIIDAYTQPAKRWSQTACPKCFKTFQVSNAIRGRMKHGDVPEIKCKQCGHRFSIVLYNPATHDKRHTDIEVNRNNGN